MTFQSTLYLRLASLTFFYRIHYSALANMLTANHTTGAAFIATKQSREEQDSRNF